MRAVIVLLLIAVAVIAGCATRTTIYEHATKDQQDFYADSSYCESISQMYVPVNGVMYPTVNRSRYDSCMRGKGWRPTNG